MTNVRRNSRSSKMNATDPTALHMYVICDSIGDIRYVGQCKDVRRRMRSHMWAETDIGDWIRNEVRAGRYPVARTLMTLSMSKRLGPGIFRWSANALENWLIAYFHGSQPGELLNKAGKPKTPKTRMAFVFPSLPKCKITKMRYDLIVSGYDRRKSRVETA